MYLLIVMMKEFTNVSLFYFNQTIIVIAHWLVVELVTWQALATSG
jgi:hypothetical protein